MSSTRRGRPLVASAVLLALLLTTCGGNVIRVVPPSAPPATEGLSPQERALVEPVAFAFVLAYRFDPEAPDRYQGDAPEPGVPIG